MAKKTYVVKKEFTAPDGQRKQPGQTVELEAKSAVAAGNLEEQAAKPAPER